MTGWSNDAAPPVGGVHATAVVDADASIHPSAAVGPYAVIGPGVRLAARVSVGPHAVLEGRLEVEEDVAIGPFACLGLPPQDRAYRGGRTGVRIGARTIIREFATIHRATEQGGGWTIVGRDGMIMAYCHIAHDCVVGDRVVMANNATLAGHVELGDDVNVGGMVAVHQTVRVGRLAFLAGNAMVERDVPPFCRAAGDRARLAGLNLVGLQRVGMSAAVTKALKEAYRSLFRQARPLAEVCESTALAAPTINEVQELVQFIRASRRGISR